MVSPSQATPQGPQALEAAAFLRAPTRAPASLVGRHGEAGGTVRPKRRSGGQNGIEARSFTDQLVNWSLASPPTSAPTARRAPLAMQTPMPPVTRAVPGSQKPAPDQLAQFDASVTTVCLPLGPGQQPVSETWELIQLSTENHNFHLHQTRFVMTGSNGGVVQDNFPLGVATPIPSFADQVANNQNGVCTIDDWRKGRCTTNPEVFNIQFTQLGEFVYHCHILEHEDGGMMARIVVVPSPS
jgi:plastocyanin